MTKDKRIIKELKEAIVERDALITKASEHMNTLIERGNNIAISLEAALSDNKVLGGRNIEMKDEIRKLINVAENLSEEIC